MEYECAVFTYAVPHRKTYDTLCLLKARGYKKVLVYALPLHYTKKFHPIYEHRPNVYDYMDTAKISEELGFTYVKADNFDGFDIDASVPVLVCGAGIIPENIIKKYRIINAHPGNIPYARGLDALKWEIEENIPVGVTTHIIGDEIDAGEIIQRKLLDVYANDTFHSLAQRVYETEIIMLVDAIGRLDEEHEYIPAGGSTVHKRMPAEIERDLMVKFEEYVRRNV